MQASRPTATFADAERATSHRESVGPTEYDETRLRQAGHDSKTVPSIGYEPNDEPVAQAINGGPAMPRTIGSPRNTR